MITINNISKSFDGRKVLSDISATFDKGKTNLIIGQSGSGKTVLLKCIVGLLEADEGEVYYNDILFNKLSFDKKKLIRQKMGMLFQGAALFDSMSVEKNVMFPLDMFTEMSKEEKLERANFCLQRVNIINANHLFPDEISGGMKKRVAIARAIALNPEFLFCDEPNSGLDPKTSVVIDHLIKDITEEYNITTLVNTHDMNSVMGIGDKVIFIYEGQKWWEGSRNDILDSDNKELNEFVFSSELTRKIKGL
ncbi:MAG: ATP-binding cassette domain-containing protein [Bacteroidales bacterium]|nr:ATP-binding cassette domain-containing protein [Bacteroidales bacterium]HPD95324.1 ATP-binding cassette domain-containing protein [Tenuifilaceae bacterium]HRX31568.1 ATP-binding cassette domain-containing protein [Tenuifilaceae bacterium]